MEKENKLSLKDGSSITFSPTYDNDGMWIHVYSADRRTHMLLGPLDGNELSTLGFSVWVANMELSEKQNESKRTP